MFYNYIFILINIEASLHFVLFHCLIHIEPTSARWLVPQNTTTVNIEVV